MSRLAPPRTDTVIAALDVGTSKVAALVTQLASDGGLRVMGVGQRANAGMRRGLVVDMGATEAAIRAAMDQAERQAGLTVEKAVVSLTGGGLKSDVASVEIPVATQRVAQEDKAALLAEGRARVSAGARTILHAQPTLYALDGMPGVLDPVGFHADRLGVDIHVITADTPPIRNLDQCVRNAHLGIRAIVASPVAAGLAALAAEERELGVALVDLGAGVTTVSVHGRGMLIEIATIPMGGADVTDDIAANFATTRMAAERIKAVSGSAALTPRDNHELLEVPPIAEDGAEPGRVTRAALNTVIRNRLEALFGLVRDRLDAMGFAGPAGRQVVLTGGGAELSGIQDFAQAILARQVRVGHPRGLPALGDGQAGAAFATLAGLALFAARDPDDLWTLAAAHGGQARNDNTRSPLARMAAMLRASL